ncbi:hypothetical protein ACT7DB_04035 [Bacillus cereus]|uniref:hypothetical protein n=1 Tax=Bacillus cereus TaxID=1396 RepID=UPI0015968E50|nr:hypothetical protein [Bacillus cereus]
MMKTYDVVFTETKTYSATVEANTLEEAANKVRDGHVECEELIEKDVTVDWMQEEN